MTGQEAQDYEREAGRGKVPHCEAPEQEQERLAGLIADWVREHLGVEHVLFGTRYGLARTILNDGYRKHPEPEITDDLETWLRVEPHEAFCVRNGISVETTNATEPVEAFLDGYRLAVSRVRELLADARKAGLDDV